jgi:NAD+ synthase
LFPEILKINVATETNRICESIRLLIQKLKKRGAVVALSGGVDSSVSASLCVESLGKDRVLGLLLPEKDSSEETRRLGFVIAEHLDIQTVHEDITPILEVVGCYKKRDNAIRSLIPEYNADFKAKIVLPSVVDNESLRLFSVIVLSPSGKEKHARLTHESYLNIVAATNFKQRVRKMLEYYHADRLNYAVIGTPNRLEFDQGFFVKLGDGAADIKPIAHLYKSQVYQLAKYLNLPEEIINRPPTTDTYSMPQSQEEFYFSLPYEKMDVCLYGKNNNIPIKTVASAVNLTTSQLEKVYQDIEQKRKTTRYLHLKPQLVEDVIEIMD